MTDNTMSLEIRSDTGTIRAMPTRAGITIIKLMDGTVVKANTTYQELYALHVGGIISGDGVHGDVFTPDLPVGGEVRIPYANIKWWFEQDK